MGDTGARCEKVRARAEVEESTLKLGVELERVGMYADESTQRFGGRKLKELL